MTHRFKINRDVSLPVICGAVSGGWGEGAPVQRLLMRLASQKTPDASNQKTTKQNTDEVISTSGRCLSDGTLLVMFSRIWDGGGVQNCNRPVSYQRSGARLIPRRLWDCSGCWSERPASVCEQKTSLIRQLDPGQVHLFVSSTKFRLKSWRSNF